MATDLSSSGTHRPSCARPAVGPRVRPGTVRPHPHRHPPLATVTRPLRRTARGSRDVPSSFGHDFLRSEDAFGGSGVREQLALGALSSCMPDVGLIVPYSASPPEAAPRWIYLHTTARTFTGHQRGL